VKPFNTIIEIMNLEQLKTKLFDLISTREITLLKDLDNRIIFNKCGKFLYYKSLELNISNISKILGKLEDNKFIV